MTEPPIEPTASSSLEDLVAEALELLDLHGEPAVATLLARHPARADAIERVIAQARANGLLQPAAANGTPSQLGDFRLLGRIGGGGMGVVHEAEQISLGRRVAVKLIRGDLLFLDSARARFHREVEAVARLHHPGIVRVISVGEAQGIPFFAMERIDGRGSDAVLEALAGRDPATLTAAAWRDAGTPASAAPAISGMAPWWQKCVTLAAEVADAMEHAHSRGIVHRDLKPSNIMVDRSGNAIVIDFGLAHIDVARRMTLAGSAPGSPAYMSPEQLRGEPSDERTDIYSLGATLYEWVGLRAPFAGDSLDAIRTAALHGCAESVRRRNRAVPRDLEVVCCAAMDVDRDRRYPSMAALANDLRAVLARRPITARPASPALRFMRCCQRHPGMTAAVVVLLMAVLVLPTVLLIQEARASARIAAQSERAQRYLGVTLEAVDGLLASFGESGLAELPGAELVSLRALEQAAALHRRLVLDQPDSPELRWARANVLATHAHALGNVGRHSEAHTQLAEVIGLLGGEDLNVATLWLYKRAEVRDNLATLQFMQGDVAAMQRQIGSALVEIDAVLAQDPARASAHHRRGHLLGTSALGQNDAAGEATVIQAEAEYRTALALIDADGGSRPDAVLTRARIHRELAALAIKLCRIHELSGRPQAVLDTASAALTALRAANCAEHRDTQRFTAELLQRQGLAMAELGGDGTVPLREAVTRLEELCREFPNRPLYTQLLAAALHNLAITIRGDSPAEAKATMLRAAELTRVVIAATPTVGGQQSAQNHLGCLVEWLPQDGETEAALPFAVELGTLPGDPWRPYAAAFHLARIVGVLRGATNIATADSRQRLAPWLDRAMAFLMEAEQRGWHAHANLDAPEFDPLRQRPEFQALRARRHP